MGLRIKYRELNAKISCLTDVELVDELERMAISISDDYEEGVSNPHASTYQFNLRNTIISRMRDTINIYRRAPMPANN